MGRPSMSNWEEFSSLVKSSRVIDKNFQRREYFPKGLNPSPIWTWSSLQKNGTLSFYLREVW
jgi:hypothetical protein